MAIEQGDPGGIESITRARLWSLSTALEHLKGFVEDNAGQSGKSVSLGLSCPMILVPPEVIDATIPAIVQLLRNSIEHGIESPMERLVAGKLLTGRLSIHVTAEPGSIGFAVYDDGAGIDAAAIADAAIRVGAIEADAARELSEAETQSLVFAPGVSLAPGDRGRRGHGLGRAVARLKPIKGCLRMVRSEVGQGTSFGVSVPFGPGDCVVLPGLGAGADSRHDVLERLILTPNGR